MKKLFTFSTVFRQQATRTPGLLAMVTGLAFGFYFATASTGVAQGNPNECAVCHKGNRTLYLPCQSSAVERHIAHGDTAGPCPATQTQAAKPETKTKAVAARKVAAPTAAARVQRSVE